MTDLRAPENLVESLVENVEAAETIESFELVELGSQPPFPTPTIPDPTGMAPSAPDRFSPFGHLATELQMMIWQLALPHPRIIGWQAYPIAGAGNSVDERNIAYNLQVPGILSASRDSREEALRQFNPTALPRNQNGNIYFNFALDALYFRGIIGALDFMHEAIFPAAFAQAGPVVAAGGTEVLHLVLRTWGRDADLELDVQDSLSALMEHNVLGPSFRSLKALYLLGEWATEDTHRDRGGLWHTAFPVIQAAWTQYVREIVPQLPPQHGEWATTPALEVPIQIPTVYLIQEDDLWPGDGEITFSEVYERVSYVAWGRGFTGLN